MIFPAIYGPVEKFAWSVTRLITAPSFRVRRCGITKGTPQNPGANDLGAGISTLCLSCHDGTVALDSFGGAAGGTNITGAALVTRDLTDDHPIAINYEDAVQTDMQPPSSTSSGIAGGTNIAADMLFGGGATNTLLECASCHDVHNGTGLSKLLIKSNAGSDLCQTCHLK
jgi:predicted CXXCH cytochrome family protein